MTLALNYGMARASVGAGGQLVNLYAQSAALGAKDDVMLVGAPGTREFATLYDGDTRDGNVNAMFAAFGKIVVITDLAMYFVSEDGSVERISEAGLPGKVSMAFNRTDVVATNGTYAYWINDDSVTLVSEPDFYPTDSATFLDGYLIFNRKGTGQVFCSGLYSRDFAGLDFADAEKAPDNTVGVLAVGDNLFIFGQESTEVWYNAANTAGFPFSRVSGAVYEHGCASMQTAAQSGGAVFWLSSAGQVVQVAGLQPQRISDEAVEAALTERRAQWADARAYFYTDEGHAFYVLTVGNLTVAYDLATGYWHQRANYSRGCAIGRCYVNAWGRHFLGDDRGRILELTSTVYEDAGEPLVAEVVTIPYTSDRKHLPIGMIEVEFDTGKGGLVLLSVSKDGGRSWSASRAASLGGAGEYRRRVRWRKLGARLDHRFRLRISDPIARRLLSKAEVTT